MGQEAGRRARILPSGRDALLAAGILLLAQLETWMTQSYQPKLPYALAAVAMTVPLAWRRAAPALVTVIALATLFAMESTGHPLDSAYIMAVLIVAFYSVGAYLDRLPATLGWLLGLALLAVLVGIETGPGAGDFLFIAIIVSGAWSLGMILRDRTARNEELEERATRLEIEREERALAAVADERARIARELHDIIAHSLSIVVVQTGAVRRRLRNDRPAEAETLSAVETTARQALQEMRRLLGVLRAEQDRLALAPQPGMKELDRLLDQMREAGLAVELTVEGQPEPIPPGLDLVGYRIVQESLVNALKHAGEAQVSVVMRYTEDCLELLVSDTGRGVDGTGGEPGHGLIGMRERVLLYGGSFQSGTRSEGSFAVHARLPLGSR